MNSVPSLAKVLSYQNEVVISRYERDYPNSKIPGKTVFTELLKYIWLGCKHSFDCRLNPTDETLHFNCTVHKEMKEIDNMWHTFLLFTREYQRFCHEYLEGVFFHHEPATKRVKPTKEKYELELSRYLSYIYDHLGGETVIAWFENE